MISIIIIVFYFDKLCTKQAFRKQLVEIVENVH